MNSNNAVHVSEYTIDNPKLVDNYWDVDGEETFTGVVKDKKDNIAYYVGGKVVRVKEFTIDNPKLVDCYFYFEGREYFTGVVKDKFGDMAHYVKGEYHRDNGPAIQCLNGNTEWRFNGVRHRKDGPAVEWDGNREWCFNGEVYGWNDDYTNESWIAFVASLK